MKQDEERMGRSFDMDDLTIVTCNYDTPDLIQNLNKSLKKYHPKLRIVVVDTSPTPNNIDNFALICSGMTHGEAVNEVFKNKMKIFSRYILLVDSDILIIKNFENVYDRFVGGGFALMGNVSGDRGGKSLYPRVDPWFCFMDLEQLKAHNIKFFDAERTKKSRGTDRVYDVGSTMFEDVVNAGLTIANVNLENKYFRHYEGMSWRVQKYDPNAPDTDIDFGGTHNNKALYEYGLKVREQYEKDVLTLG